MNVIFMQIEILNFTTLPSDLLGILMFFGFSVLVMKHECMLRFSTFMFRPVSFQVSKKTVMVLYMYT
jgi:hypothetical protein